MVETFACIVFLPHSSSCLVIFFVFVCWFFACQHLQEIQLYLQLEDTTNNHVRVWHHLYQLLLLNITGMTLLILLITKTRDSCVIQNYRQLKTWLLMYKVFIISIRILSAHMLERTQHWVSPHVLSRPNTRILLIGHNFYYQSSTTKHHALHLTTHAISYVDIEKLKTCDYIMLNIIMPVFILNILI